MFNVFKVTDYKKLYRYWKNDITDLYKKIWIIMLSICFFESDILNSHTLDGVINSYMPLMLAELFAVAVLTTRCFSRDLISRLIKTLDIVYLECIGLILVIFNLHLLVTMTIFFRNISMAILIVYSLIYVAILNIVYYFYFKKNVSVIIVSLIVKSIITLVYILGVGNMLGCLYDFAITHTTSRIILTIILILLVLTTIVVYVLILKGITEDESDRICKVIKLVIPLMILPYTVSLTYKALQWTVTLLVWIIWGKINYL